MPVTETAAHASRPKQLRSIPTGAKKKSHFGSRAAVGARASARSRINCLRLVGWLLVKTEDKNTSRANPLPRKKKKKMGGADLRGKCLEGRGVEEADGIGSLAPRSQADPEPVLTYCPWASKNSGAPCLALTVRGARCKEAPGRGRSDKPR